MDSLIYVNSGTTKICSNLFLVRYLIESLLSSKSLLSRQISERFLYLQIKQKFSIENFFLKYYLILGKGKN